MREDIRAQLEDTMQVRCAALMARTPVHADRSCAGPLIRTARRAHGDRLPRAGRQWRHSFGVNDITLASINPAVLAAGLTYYNARLDNEGRPINVIHAARNHKIGYSTEDLNRCGAGGGGGGGEATPPSGMHAETTPDQTRPRFRGEEERRRGSQVHGLYDGARPQVAAAQRRPCHRRL